MRYQKSESGNISHTIPVKYNSSNTVQLVDKRPVNFLHSDLSTMIIAQQKETTLPHEENRMLQYFGINNTNVQGNTIQCIDPPTTKERTKKAAVFDRHAIPHPFFDLGGWYKTLMTARIADLYRTPGGFLGHAQQIQQELDRLIPLIEGGLFLDPVSMETAITYEDSIRNFIVNQARENVRFDFPKFIFRFSRQKVVGVERTDGRFIGG